MSDINVMIVFCTVFSAISCMFNMILFYLYPALNRFFRSCIFQNTIFCKFRTLLSGILSACLFTVLLLAFCLVIPLVLK